MPQYGTTRGLLAGGLLTRAAPFQDTVSVHRPSFYAERFFKFMSNTVFRKNSCELPAPRVGGPWGERAG